MAKFGPASVAVLVDGYNASGWKLGGWSHEIANPVEECTALGDSWATHAPTGVQSGVITQERAFWDTTAGKSHEALANQLPTTPQSAVRIACFMYAGNTSGADFIGTEGSYQASYNTVAAPGELQKANVEWQITGKLDAGGVVVNVLETQTGDWDTEGSGVDNGASSADGGAGYLQVTAASGFTSFAAKIRDSTDDITYADLVTFAAVTPGGSPVAERVEVAGTVNQYLAFDGVFTGVGSITLFAGFRRF